MPTKFVGVTSFGIGGVGKSTIALALATEFSKYDLSILFDSSHIYELLKSSTMMELPRAKIFGNLIVVGIERKRLNVLEEQSLSTAIQLPYIDHMNDRLIDSIRAIVEIINRRLKREVKFAIIDFPTYIEETSIKKCLKICDCLVVVLRPYMRILKEISKIGKSIKVEEKVIGVLYVLNMWPSNVKYDSKTVKKLFNIDPSELKDLDITIVPELDVVKDEKSPLTVAQYIVKRGYLKRLVEKILEMEGLKETTSL